jgi:hypothetical protein
MKVYDSRPRRRDHRHRPVRPLRETEGEEAGGALVDAYVQAEVPGGGCVEHHERQRG